MQPIKELLKRFGKWLAGLSFRTGVIVGLICIACYIISFAQMALPVGAGLKAALWVIFFGFAKAAQYSALLVLGKEGIRRIRTYFRHRI